MFEPLPAMLPRITAVLIALTAGLAPQAARRPVRPDPGTTLTVSATAYCVAGRTKSGLHTRRGIVAADPRVLPVGSVVRVIAPGKPYAGIYTVMDTGADIRGRELDIFMKDCGRARTFGRRDVRVRVLRRGGIRKKAPPRRPGGRADGADIAVGFPLG